MTADWSRTASASLSVSGLPFLSSAASKVADKAGMKSVNYAALVAPVIEAIKTQQSEIDGLKALLCQDHNDSLLLLRNQKKAGPPVQTHSPRPFR